MKHFQSKVLTAAILAALSGSAMAADVYEKPEVDKKITAVEEKITAAKADLDQKLEAQKTSNSEEIKKVKDVVKNLIEGDDQNPGLIDTITDLNTSVESNKSEIKSNKSEIEKLTTNLADTDAALDKTTEALNKAEEKITAFATETEKNIEAINKKLDEASESVNSSLDDINTKADTALSTADEAKKIAEDTKNSVNDNVKAAKDAASEAKTAAGEAKKVAEKVTDIEEAAEVALVAAHKNTQDIHGFKAGDIIYKKDENGNFTETKATEADVKADDFEGLGLKEVVAKHDESLG